MRRVKDDSSQASRGSSDDGNGQDPPHHDPSESSPVERLQVAVAERDSEGRTGDAHGRRDGEGVLGSEEDGDGGSELHRESSRGRVQGESVSEDSHEIGRAHV